MKGWEDDSKLTGSRVARSLNTAIRKRCIPNGAPACKPSGSCAKGNASRTWWT